MLTSLFGGRATPSFPALVEPPDLPPASLLPANSVPRDTYAPFGTPASTLLTALPTVPVGPSSSAASSSSASYHYNYGPGPWPASAASGATDAGGLGGAQLPLGEGVDRYDGSAEVAPMPFMRVAGWIFSGPIRHDLPFEQRQAEERLRMMRLYADALFNFLYELAGWLSRKVSVQELWVGGAAAGAQAIDTLLAPLTSYSDAALRLGQLNTTLLDAMRASAGGLAPSSATLPGAALSSAAAGGTGGLGELARLIRATASGSTATDVPPALPDWLSDAIAKGTVTRELITLWLLQAERPLDLQRLQQWQQLLAPEPLRNLTERQQLLNFTEQLHRFFQRNGEAWVEKIEDSGMLFLKSDVWKGLRAALRDVHEAAPSGMAATPWIELVTHEHVKTPFARLVAAHIDAITVDNPNWVASQRAKDDHTRRLRSAKLAFDSLYRSDGRLMLRVPGSNRAVYNDRVDRERLRREDDVYREAARTGRYPTGLPTLRSSEFMAPDRTVAPYADGDDDDYYALPGARRPGLTF
jgi:hypothetical protein